MSANRIFHKLLRLPKVLRGKDFYFPIQIKKECLEFGNDGANWTFIPEYLDKNSIVYSFGVGEDISFDLELINKFDLQIHAFDPTPKSIKWVASQKTPANLILHQYGLSDKNGEVIFYPPKNPNHVSATLLDRPEIKENAYKVEVKNIVTILKELNHNNIDLLKIDIEGAEYNVIDNIIDSKININQLLIEFHHRFANVGMQQTKDAVIKLNKAGYLIFNISKTGEEYSFMKNTKV